MVKDTFRAALALMLIASGSTAQEIEEKSRLAIADFIFEAIECASFYSIISNLENSSPEWTAMAKNYENLTEEMYLSAFDLANKIQLNPDVLILKAQTYTSEMGQIIGHDAINISLLLEKHGAFCKSLAEEPATRLQYWLNKEK